MAKLTDETRASLRRRSRLVNLGRDSELSHGFVNIPPFRGSTVLYPDVATLKKGAQRFTYGRRNSPTIEALSSAWSDLAGAAGTVLVPSGLAAITASLITALGAGDHLLMADTVYGPSREVANKLLKRMGIETTYYDPMIGADIASLMRAEHQGDIHRVAGLGDARSAGRPGDRRGRPMRATFASSSTTPGPLRSFSRPTPMASTWLSKRGPNTSPATPTCCIGLVSANEKWFQRLHRTVGTMGIPAGPEDVFLALRGLRTMELRLREAERQALALAHWLDERPEVLRVIHPALPDHPGHAFWKRDFTGSSGLFSVVLKPASDAAVAAMLDGLELFGLGYSWAGFESLVVPVDCTPRRTATRFAPGGPMLRFSVGLEDIEDLKADLDRGFARLRATA